uniref:Uncharacterized protein n=1 Tax=Globisporangium ultimum (strain ATCC 200006 / CBS 805.95 / DAOM BR144) TaxID=431595 RepID=K3W8T2_GLOUD
MSCLLLEDEQAATLAEALAFLDEFSHFEADSSTANGFDLDEGVASDNTTDSDQSLRVFFRLPPSSSSASLPPRLEVRNRDRRNAAIGQTLQLSDQRSTLPKRKASTTLADIKKQQPQKRQRDASRVRELREQVLHLTAQLVRLQELADKQPSNANPPSLRYLENAVGSLGDRDVVTLELERLQRSETLNRKLKKALAKQRKQNTTVAKILHKQLTQHDKELLMPPKQELYDRVSEVTATISMRNTSRVFNNSHVSETSMMKTATKPNSNGKCSTVRKEREMLARAAVRSSIR